MIKVVFFVKKMSYLNVRNVILSIILSDIVCILLNFFGGYNIVYFLIYNGGCELEFVKKGVYEFMYLDFIYDVVVLEIEVLIDGGVKWVKIDSCFLKGGLFI